MGLVLAIEEECNAKVLFQRVLDVFRDIEPFNRILPSETQYIAALVRKAEKFGVSVPEYSGSDTLPTSGTISEACQAGVKDDMAVAAL